MQSTGTFEGLRGLFDSPLQESIEIMEYLGLYSPNLLRTGEHLAFNT
jgi:hypothetical protein